MQFTVVLLARELMSRAVVPSCTALLMHPSLWVYGPVDDVKENVCSGKNNPRVLVYGVGVDPDVNITSGCLHLACDLRVVQRHLGQNSFLAATIFRHPIVSCGVDIHGPVPGDLWVDHHLVRVADATRARQLHKQTRNSLVSYMLFFFSAHLKHLNDWYETFINIYKKRCLC